MLWFHKMSCTCRQRIVFPLCMMLEKLHHSLLEIHLSCYSLSKMKRCLVGKLFFPWPFPIQLKFIILHCYHLVQHCHLKETFSNTNIRARAVFLINLLKTSIFFCKIDVDKKNTKKRNRQKNKMKWVVT